MQKCLKVFLKKDGIYFQDFDGSAEFSMDMLTNRGLKISYLLLMRAENGEMMHIAIVEENV